MNVSRITNINEPLKVAKSVAVKNEGTTMIEKIGVKQVASMFGMLSLVYFSSFIVQNIHSFTS